ncbi:MAG: DUF4062 domain-containing protein [Ginsengibacter sp.]
MNSITKQFKVFVASPGDVSIERNVIPKVVAEINLIISAIAPEKGILLDLIRWETHVHPGLGADAQDVVNQQLPDYDIFIGIMWKRFGTPTSRAGSGTEEEYLRAYEKWKQDNKFPVLFYFSQKEIMIPNSSAELEQLQKVVKFKEDLINKGLIWEYNNPEEFGDILRPHLVMTLSKLLNDKDAIAANNQSVEKAITHSDMSLIRNRVTALKSEYEKLRETSPASNTRTTKMSVVESKMRAMALDIIPLLPELTESPSAGDRLAAIAALKEIPVRDYLNWLANRVGQAESSFVGFNASLALLNAVRRLDGQSVLSAIQKAIENLDNSPYKDPNQVKVLNDAFKKAKENI